MIPVFEKPRAAHHPPMRLCCEEGTISLRSHIFYTQVPP
jgi:hypothetical protein